MTQPALFPAPAKTAAIIRHRRNAYPNPCPRCGTPTITGPDDHTTAAKTTCDPIALTPDLETAARILGRQTFELHTTADSHYLTHRPPEFTRPTPDRTILAAHQCGTPPLPGTPIDLEHATRRWPGHTARCRNPHTCHCPPPY